MSISRSRTTSRDSRTLSLEDDGLDPHIREELEQLNSTSEEINTLEKELEILRHTYRSTRSDLAQRLLEKRKQHPRAIKKAKAFHDAKIEAKEALKKAQEAAHKYHNVVDIYNAAKETIEKAESTTCDGEKRREFDAALQEMLNHATAKLNGAKEEKDRSKIDHDQKAQSYREAQHNVDSLARKFKSSIAKSRPYYDIKLNFDEMTKELAEKVNSKQRQLVEAKTRYKEALMHLEAISESIHEKRELRATIDAQRRGIGVGAEIDHQFEELQVFNLDIPDDDSASDAGSVDSDRHLTEVEKQSDQAPGVSRHLSGCSASDLSKAVRDTKESGESDEIRLQQVRESGDGLSPTNRSSPEKHFKVDAVDGADGNSDEDTDVSKEKNDEEREIRAALRDSSMNEANGEHSEESGYADASSSEVSEIDVDELFEEQDGELSLSPGANSPSLSVVSTPAAPVMKRKPLKKLIPDMDKDEIWL